MYNLFISYQWDSKDLVLKIVNELKENYRQKIWIDENEIIAGKDLHSSIQNGINNSELILAFVTKKYCESASCIQEIKYSNRTNKKILFIILEKLEIKRLPNGMGLFVSEKCCFNVYNQLWTEKTLLKLAQTIISVKNEL
jgi:hypothetical protein